VEKNMDSPVTWEQLKDYYHSKRGYCSNGRRGRSYKYRHDTLEDLPCDSITCGKCRPGIKKQIHNLTVEQIQKNDLDQHFVITSPGKQFRKEHDYANSYAIQEYEWNKYRFKIKHHFPDFTWIRLPRAQAKPTGDNPVGFAHQHIITNKPIHKRTGETLSFKWLTENKKRYQLGFVWIRENQSVAEYLHKDFYDDDEWVIPISKRHFSTSRDIILRPNGRFEKNPDNLYFQPQFKIDQIEQKVNEVYSRPLPFPEYVKQFYTNTLKKEHPPLSGEYRNGILVKPFIKKRRNTHGETTT